jgi:hypothetical protein
MDVEPTSQRKEDRMFRKSLLAMAAVAALGAGALAPTSASAHWNGWYGYKPYPYWRSYGPRYFHGGFYRPRYVYGGWKYGGWTYRYY